jgi:hypothetical protein
MKNDKTLKKEIIVDARIWKDILCVWIRRINVVKMVTLQKVTYIFNAISTKIPMSSRFIYLWKIAGFLSFMDIYIYMYIKYLLIYL